MTRPPSAILPWLYAADETRSGPSAHTSIILSCSAKLSVETVSSATEDGPRLRAGVRETGYGCGQPSSLSRACREEARVIDDNVHGLEERLHRLVHRLLGHHVHALDDLSAQSLELGRALPHEVDSIRALR